MVSRSEDCLFCKIINKKVASFAIYEDKSTLAFLDVMPRAPGHALVIPKHHAKSLTELPDSEVGPLFAAVKSAAQLLIKALKARGLTLGINQGAVSGQVVEHIHVHVIPRFENDGGGSIQSVIDSKSEKTLEEIQKIILKVKK